MSSNYYSMRDAKVRIAHELMNRGWKVEGYKADESDSMTDYYSPANWDGIATKNGYILVVDHTTAGEAREIKKWNPKGNLSIEDRERISKLEAMTQERGATAGEEENAKALIEKIQQKVSSEPAYEVIGMTLAHMANPGKCKWHIEKDGKLYDKGTGLTKYADMPNEWQYDIIKMDYKDGYKYYSDYNNERHERTITDEQKKIINDFKSLILRFERIASGINPMGDGTAETEEAGKEQQQKEGYEKVIKTITKKVIKPVEKEDKTICVNDVLSFKYHGHYWIVTDIYNNSKNETCITYELLGSAKRGYQRLSGTTLTGKRYYQRLSKLEKEITEGITKVYTLQEVEEVEQVEKWEKINKTKRTYNKKSESKQEEKTEQSTAEEQPKESIINHEYTITADTDTRDNSPLWVVKIIDTLSKDEYIKIAEQFKALKGYYSKFKHGFIFKYDPTSILKGNNSETKTEPQNPYKQLEIKDGYLYSCHFKEWNLSITEIQDRCRALNIEFEDLGCKIGFTALTADQTRQIKTISDENQSIFFIDKEVEQMEVTEQDQETAEAIIDYSTDIITEMNLKHLEYTYNEEYKNKLLNTLKDRQIKINKTILFYLYKNGYELLEEVITDFLRQQEEEQKKLEQQQAEKTALLEKINKSIESLQSKIDSLSGDYKTNTYKRMKEQENRDSKKESLEIDIKLLEYVQQKLIDNISITAVEKGLTVGAFRDMIHQYYVTKYGRYPREIKFPCIDYSIPLDGWYNKEVPQKQKKLQKYNITNSIELNNAIDEYKEIYDNRIDRSYKNPLQQQIKKLENEYKLRQKGDINFTPLKVVERLIEYSQIDNNSIVLEPSAGIGNIADQIKAITNNVDCIEYMNHFSELLKMKKHNVVSDDIMQYNRFNYYDAVIMNPPFSEEIEHIKHAYKTLKAGGKLISITSPSWTFNNNRKSQEFREWFESVGGEILEELESGTFEMTGVKTLIIEINKEEETTQEAI
jgi:predicted RNA methylase